jgi:transcriptional regulator with XRE-family HTH domain
MQLSSDTRVLRGQLKNLMKGVRGRLTPADVGIESTGRRRVSGLRREEVATLAGLNVLYYTRFERGEISISLEAFLRVCDALQLSRAESAHMALLAFPLLRNLFTEHDIRADVCSGH